MSKRVGIYVRISKEKPQDRKARLNDEEAKRNWERRQLKACRAKAKAQGWEVAHVYRDEDISAYSGKKRPAYEEMLRDLRDGAIDGVIFWKLDRLVRRTIEFHRFYEVCDKAGAVFASATESFDTTTPIGRGIVGLLVSLAEQESFNMALRLSSHYEQRAGDGLPKGNGTRPFGYGADWLTVRRDEAKLIRTAAKRILGGDSLLGIVNDWNDRGIRTTRGNEWSPRTLKLILLSPRVAGLVQHKGEVKLDENGEPVRAAWPAILTHDQRELLQHVLLDPSRRRVFNQGQRIYLLTGKDGVGYCGCGKRLRARPRKTRDDKEAVRAYACAGNSCGVSAPADELEDFVRDAVIEALQSDRLEQLIREETGEASAESEQLDALRSAEAKLLKLDDDFYGGTTVLTEERYRRQVTRLQQRVEELRFQLASNGKTKVLVDIPRSRKAMQKAWAERGVDWRRTLTAAVLKKVIVNPKRKSVERELVWRA